VDAMAESVCEDELSLHSRKEKVFDREALKPAVPI